MTHRWISIPKWRKFQHYDPTKRTPPWVKVYTDLMNSDAYLHLTAAERGILLGIWLEYANSRCELRDDTLSLTRRLSVKVSRKHLEALNQAGFIDFVASKTLAEGYHDASARAHASEVEVEKEKPSFLPTPTRDEGQEGKDFENEDFPPALPPVLTILQDMPA